uniref:Uncharacterized protein n=1 Tax=Theropithecus gelada TaxID=9565 RepID=A0A8D2ESA1_THEGE
SFFLGRAGKRRGRPVAKPREGPTPNIALDAELIELGESNEVVDLTCESLEPVVTDLTHHDSVVILEQRRRPRANTRSLQDQTGSCVVNTDEEGLKRDRDACTTNSAHHNSLQKKFFCHILPGYIRCQVCVDGYSEIELSIQHTYSIECGHICSQCFCTSFKYTNTCPVCLEKKKSAFVSITAFIYDVCLVAQDRACGWIFPCLCAGTMSCWHPTL